MIKDKYPKNMKYRLPTEVEWEFVARGGKYSNKYPFKYSGSDKLEEVGWFGWFDENIYGKRTQGELKDVALKTPNLLGVYDMSGSVWEWCQNNIIGNITSNHTTIGSCKEPDSTEYSAYRGGSWLSSHLECTPFSRMKAKANSMNYMLGFRLAFS